MDFDLVIFDCDGVLIDSEIISARMLVAELAGMGVSIDMAYVAHHFLGRSYPTVMKVIKQDFGVNLTPEFEESYRTRLLAAFARDLKAITHVHDVLGALSVPWCIATSSSPVRAKQSLGITGLSEVVGSKLFTASEVPNGKPAPDLFLHAAAKMGATPARCLVIEDSLNGIRAARAAGMPVWRFVGGSHLRDTWQAEPEGAIPDLHFDSFADFASLTANRLANPTKA
ncbi:HAD family hydrolase [Pseudorhodobacter sp. E13]|uniref:HAD family hydrolase n=1 Tax=Pseudorhodobacter sp. E13 TaxID=2487931 RepID=UPI000F8ECD3A|nr:HAD family hydrolase [Pseudorhodobacter sp. E13]RUS60992.1 HAD family hydrolase [Pseudorhodobacter sp. E13]